MTTSATDPCKSATWSTVGPWNAPELDSPAQRAKWDRAAARPDVIEIRVKGTVAGQGSKTLTKWGAMRESSSLVAPWRSAVIFASEQQYKGPVISGPVAIEMTFLLPRAKHHWSTAKGKEDQLKPSAPVHCTLAPDIDKAARSTCDALTAKCGGNVLEDDRQVVELLLKKRYAERTESVGALVKIIPLR